MDVARFPYDHECVMFRDGGPQVTLHWYPAPPNAKVFPASHKFNCLNWYSRPWLADGVGEIYGPRDKYNGGVTPPTVDGQDYCGTLDDFQQGPAFNPLVNVPRDVWGVATCCSDGEPINYILEEPSSHPVILLEDGTGAILKEDN